MSHVNLLLISGQVKHAVKSWKSRSDQSQQSELTGVNEHVHVRGSPLIYHAEFNLDTPRPTPRSFIRTRCKLMKISMGRLKFGNFTKKCMLDQGSRKGLIWATARGSILEGP